MQAMRTKTKAQATATRTAAPSTGTRQLLPTKTESQTITRQLIHDTFSGLFGDENFVDCRVHDMQLKRLERGTSAEADTLLDWIERGCYDAIEKQYLKTIVLGVYLDADHATDMVETYTFNVSYPVVGPEIRLESSVAGTKGDSTHVSTLRSSHAEIKKSTQQLMRTLVVLVQTLRPLPDCRYITMKLHYDDDKTPPDYEPPLFRAAVGVEGEYHFSTAPTKIKLGEVDARYHKLDVKMYTAIDQLDDDLLDGNGQSDHTQRVNLDTLVEEDEQLANDEQAAAHVHEHTKFSQTPVYKPNKRGVTVDELASKMDMMHADAGNQVMETETKAVVVDRVHCLCGFNRTDLGMIACDKCHLWQHLFCAGFEPADEDRLPERYECLSCLAEASANPEAAREKYADLALLRRAMCTMWEEGYKATSTLQRRLGIRWARAMFARNQLVQDGIIVENKGAARRKAHFSVIKNPATIAIKARYMQPPAAAAAASSTSEHREEQIMLSGEVAPTHEGSIVLSSPVQHSAIVMETSPMTLAAAQEARRSVRFSDALTVVPSSMQLTSEECGSHGEADFTQATQVLPESEDFASKLFGFAGESVPNSQSTYMADVNDEIVDDAPEESTTRRVVKKRKVSVAAKTIIV